MDAQCAILRIMYVMIALISDVHGNFVALQEVLRAIETMGIRQIYSLGDVVGYYSQVNECCDELRRRGILSLMGNHDWYMVSGTNCPRSRSVNDCLQYQRSVISHENLEWLSQMPVYRVVDGIHMVHGGWENPIDEYLSLPVDGYFDKIVGAFFVSGHSHMQKVVSFNGKTYCNPGSVGQPRDGDNRAAFATFDGSRFELHRIAYDYNEVGRLMELAGFSGYYYGCLKKGSRNLQW